MKRAASLSRLSVLALLVASLAACGGGVGESAGTAPARPPDAGPTIAIDKDVAQPAATQPATTVGATQPRAATPSVFDLMHTAADTTAYAGTRNVWFRTGGRARTGSSTRPTEISYAEQVACDGAGQFTIDTKGVRSPGISQANADVLQLLQKGREAFSFRYRDFRVRDGARMLQNYSVNDTGQSEVVAGRTCDVFEFERVSTPELRGGHRYRVAVDATTRVVLKCEEFDASHVLVASMEYVRIVYAPPPKTTVYHTDLAATAFDPSQTNLKSVLGFGLTAPTLVSGFQLARAERVELQQRVWARLVYDDGVEPFFFLQSGNRVVSRATRDTGLTASSKPREAPVVRVFEAGVWTVAQCSIDGADYIVAGKVPERVLLGALQSALR